MRTAAGLVKVSVENTFFPEPATRSGFGFRPEHIRWLDRESGTAIRASAPAVDPQPPSLVA